MLSPPKRKLSFVRPLFPRRNFTRRILLVLAVIQGKDQGLVPHLQGRTGVVLLDTTPRRGRVKVVVTLRIAPRSRKRMPTNLKVFYLIL